MIKLLPDVTAEELFLAYDIRSRACELRAPMKEAYGCEVEVTFDDDALMMACVEMIRLVRDGEV